MRTIEHMAERPGSSRHNWTAEKHVRTHAHSSGTRRQRQWNTVHVAWASIRVFSASPYSSQLMTTVIAAGLCCGVPGMSITCGSSNGASPCTTTNRSAPLRSERSVPLESMHSTVYVPASWSSNSNDPPDWRSTSTCAIMSASAGYSRWPPRSLATANAWPRRA